jgi:hypothetical protein
MSAPEPFLVGALGVSNGECAWVAKQQQLIPLETRGGANSVLPPHASQQLLTHIRESLPLVKYRPLRPSGCHYSCALFRVDPSLQAETKSQRHQLMKAFESICEEQQLIIRLQRIGRHPKYNKAETRRMSTPQNAGCAGT